jgi:hypothetical protein
MTHADTERECECCHAQGCLLVAVPNGTNWTRLCVPCLEKFDDLRKESA